MNGDFLNRGRVATVTMAPPGGSQVNSRTAQTGINVAVSGPYGASLEGRLSIAMLMGLVGIMLAFYVWTRGVQGGR